MIKNSEVLVLILGTQYGSSFAGADKSIVEWEYEQAGQQSAIEIQG